MTNGRFLAHGSALVVFTVCLSGLCLSTVFLLRTPPAAFDPADWQWIAIGQSALGFCTWLSFAIAALSGRAVNAPIAASSVEGRSSVPSPRAVESHQ